MIGRIFGQGFFQAKAAASGGCFRPGPHRTPTNHTQGGKFDEHEATVRKTHHRDRHRPDGCRGPGGPGVGPAGAHQVEGPDPVEPPGTAAEDLRGFLQTREGPHQRPAGDRTLPGRRHRADQRDPDRPAGQCAAGHPRMAGLRQRPQPRLRGSLRFHLRLRAALGAGCLHALQGRPRTAARALQALRRLHRRRDDAGASSHGRPRSPSATWRTSRASRSANPRAWKPSSWPRPGPRSSSCPERKFSRLWTRASSTPPTGRTASINDKTGIHQVAPLFHLPGLPLHAGRRLHRAPGRTGTSCPRTSRRSSSRPAASGPGTPSRRSPWTTPSW